MTTREMQRVTEAEPAPPPDSDADVGRPYAWLAGDTQTLSRWFDAVLETIPPGVAMLHGHPIEQARAETLAAVRRRGLDPRRLDLSSAAGCTVTALGAVQNRIDAIQQHISMQEASLRFAVVPEARARLILDTCRFLGASRRRLRADRRALRRWFDWPAVRERAEHTVQRSIRCQQALVLFAGRLHGFVDPAAFSTMAMVTGFFEWSNECFSRSAAPCLERELTSEWARLLSTTTVNREDPHTQDLIAHLRQRATNPHADVWVQVNAVEGWREVDADESFAAVSWRFGRAPTEPEHNLFFRRAVLDETVRRLPEQRALQLIGSCFTHLDRSPHVRQGAILALRSHGNAAGMRTVQRAVLPALAKEEVPQVRAAFSVLLGSWLRGRGDEHGLGAETVLGTWLDHLRGESDASAHEIAVRHLGDAVEERLLAGTMAADVAASVAGELLVTGAEQEWGVPVRRGIEDFHERVAVVSLPGLDEFRERVVKHLDELPLGSEIRIEDEEGELDDDTLGRFLAWAARSRAGLYAKRQGAGWRLRFGITKSFRWWRFLHETRRKAPDKRQAFDHLTGRRGFGTIRAHSALMAEESPTKVPGEPLRVHDEGDWRRFLPPLDDFLDCIVEGPITVYGSQGRTRIEPPDGRRARLRAWLELTRRYARYAALREESQISDPEVAASSYVESLRSLGFRVGWFGYLAAGLCTATPYFASSSGGSEPC